MLPHINFWLYSTQFYQVSKEWTTGRQREIIIESSPILFLLQLNAMPR